MAIDVDQLGLDLGDGIGLLLRRVYPLAMATAYADAGAALDLDLAFDVESARVQDVLDDLAQQVGRVAETTRDEIRALVGQSATEGWSTAQLAAAIRALAGLAGRRADLIAQTELADAYSRASLLAYADSGVVGAVEWLTAPTDACPVCAPLNGTRVPLGENWPGGIAHPPAHPGCRCAIAPIVEGL